MVIPEYHDDVRQTTDISQLFVSPRVRHPALIISVLEKGGPRFSRRPQFYCKPFQTIPTKSRILQNIFKKIQTNKKSRRSIFIFQKFLEPDHPPPSSLRSTLQNSSRSSKILQKIFRKFQEIHINQENPKMTFTTPTIPRPSRDASHHPHRGPP